MEISPQAVAAASFRTARRGYDPEEVRTFLAEVSRTLETAQQHATAMEARARAAVQRLQEVAQAPREADVAVPADDAETISRTLLLAQRTADATIAEARAEADALLVAARSEAATLVAEARRTADQHLAEARSEARRAMEAERLKVENEVQSLVARREFLLADVEHLEEFAASQRRRLEDTAELLKEIAGRAPGGLGELRRPLLSAAAEPLPGQDVGSAGEAPTAVVTAAELDGGQPAEAPVDRSVPTADELARIWEPVTPARDVDSGVAFADRVAVEPAAGAATEEYVDSEPTPNQQASLLDFDAITEQLPAVQRPEPDDELRLRDDA
jgi:DivIVA domain-containing protein